MKENERLFLEKEQTAQCVECCWGSRVNRDRSSELIHPSWLAALSKAVSMGVSGTEVRLEWIVEGVEVRKER